MTPAYEGLMRSLPVVFVGQPCCLAPVVNILAAEMETAFMEAGRIRPPWRSPAVMLARWMSDSCADLPVPQQGAAPAAVAAFVAAATAPLSTDPTRPPALLLLDGPAGQAQPVCAMAIKGKAGAAAAAPVLRSQHGFTPSSAASSSRLAGAALMAAGGDSSMSISTARGLRSRNSSCTGTQASGAGGGSDDEQAQRVPSAAVVLTAIMQACDGDQRGVRRCASGTDDNNTCDSALTGTSSSSDSILYASGSVLQRVSSPGHTQPGDEGEGEEGAAYLDLVHRHHQAAAAAGLLPPPSQALTVAALAAHRASMEAAAVGGASCSSGSGGVGGSGGVSGGVGSRQRSLLTARLAVMQQQAPVPAEQLWRTAGGGGGSSAGAGQSLWMQHLTRAQAPQAAAPAALKDHPQQQQQAAAAAGGLRRLIPQAALFGR
jgi:hypothetical protein